jgi:hypothetical protein
MILPFLRQPARPRLSSAIISEERPVGKIETLEIAETKADPKVELQARAPLLWYRSLGGDIKP